jgi:hypothetical protein
METIDQIKANWIPIAAIIGATMLLGDRVRAVFSAMAAAIPQGTAVGKSLTPDSKPTRTVVCTKFCELMDVCEAAGKPEVAKKLAVLMQEAI